MVKIKKEDIEKVRILTKLAKEDIKIEGVFGFEFKSVYTLNIKDA
jgi:hypothetical protein